MISIHKKEKSLFSFQKLNKYFLLPFFVPIVCFSLKFFSYTMKTDNGNKDIKDVTEDNEHTFAFLYKIIQSICQILGGLVYFIVHCIYKTKSGTQITNPRVSFNNIDEVKRIIYGREKKCKKIIIILFMPLALITYNTSMAYAVGQYTLEKRIYFLFFVTILNIIIFKKRIYRHQKFALIISVIGIIPIIIVFGLFLNADKYNIYYDIFVVFGGFGFPLYLILIKYLTTNKRMNIFLLLLLQGILAFIYTVILFSAVSYLKKGDFTYIYNIIHCNENNYICISHFYRNIIGFIILNIILQLLFFLVVYFFSPELLIISDIFSPLFTFIANCIQLKEDNGLKISLTILGYLIIAFASFIYNELIVCNFCKLNENTWKAIDQKAYDDMNIVDRKDSFIYNEQYIVENVEPSDTDTFEEMNQY